MLLLLVSLLFGVFFYCQALCSGMNRKAWAVAGLFLGPLIWPLFNMEKRMKVYKRFGGNWAIWKP
ncbi:hypothetical protein [Thalassotalea aquiviva]|uniref:hypothetical protein n=1 Tax=Thalassotalea aquiviva TaxID=3242415 RepID=UPI00352B8B56